MNNVYLSAFGGSGENGRNCYLIGIGDEFILLDCGVKREIVNGQIGFYPALTKELVSKIKAVFLSHCHEDHVAGLPLLYELQEKIVIDEGGIPKSFNTVVYEKILVEYTSCGAVTIKKRNGK